jgi:hypothetical protein
MLPVVNFLRHAISNEDKSKGALYAEIPDGVDNPDDLEKYLSDHPNEVPTIGSRGLRMYCLAASLGEGGVAQVHVYCGE